MSAPADLDAFAERMVHRARFATRMTECMPTDAFLAISLEERNMLFRAYVAGRILRVREATEGGERGWEVVVLREVGT